jgi:hyperosmotically inducible periplasmic protein
MQDMNLMQRKRVALAPALALLLALGACNRAGGMPGERSDLDTGKSQGSDVLAARDAQQASGSAAAAADAPPDGTRAMGASGAEKVDDAAITAQVNAGLAGAKDLGTSKIDVDTQNGVVTLSGPTPSATAKERAAEIAHRVKGVQSVNNQLTITSG